MTTSSRDEKIETILRAEFSKVWDWTRDKIDEPFGPDDIDYVDQFEGRLGDFRERARADLAQLSDQALAVIREEQADDEATRDNAWCDQLSVNPKNLIKNIPPTIAYGFGHPRFAPDFKYWCQMPRLDLYEATALSVGADPKSMTEKRLYELKKTAEKGRDMWSAYTFLLERFELMTRFFPSTGFGFAPVPLSTLDNWFRDIDLHIHPGLRRAIDNRLGETSAQVVTVTKSLTSQERATLLKLFAAMSCEQYGYDPKKPRSEATSRIAEDLDRVGITMDPKTIRKWLKTASEAVDDAYWDN